MTNREHPLRRRYALELALGLALLALAFWWLGRDAGVGAPAAPAPVGEPAR